MSCTYDPDIFPGLIFRMGGPKKKDALPATDKDNVKLPSVVLLIFSSGKIVLTGAKHREDIYTAYNKIKYLLRDHKQEE